MTRHSILHLPSAILLCLLLVGCGDNTAVSHGKSTALDDLDLVEISEQMTQSLLAAPDVQKEIAAHGKLKVVIQPVENKMTAEVLPRGAKDAFIHRLRNCLARTAPDKFAWVANRDTWHALRQAERDPGPDPDRTQPDFALTARFTSITKESSEHRSSYYHCAYRLTDLRTGEELWTSRYEVKKTATKEFLD